MITKLPSRFTRVVVLPVIVATFVVPSVAHGAPILPTSIAGLKLWLKADDIADGAEPADGAAVSLWRDRSGNGHDSAKVTDITDPISDPIKQTVTIPIPGGTNTFPVVRFDGETDELMRSADIILGADGTAEVDEAANFGNLTILTVYQTTVRSANNRTAGFGTSLADNRGGQNAENYHLANDPSIRKDNGSVRGFTAQVPAEFFVRSSVMTTDGGGSITDFFDGVEVLSSTANYNVRSDNFYLGDVRFRTGDNLDLAEVIVYDSALGDADRAGVEEYLTNKYFTAIPEPGSLALAAIGLLAVLGCGRRRRIAR